MITSSGYAVDLDAISPVNYRARNAINHLITTFCARFRHRGGIRSRENGVISNGSIPISILTSSSLREMEMKCPVAYTTDTLKFSSVTLL